MRILFFLLVGTLIAVGEVIPAARLTDWTPGTRTGVTGGIDQYQPGGVNQRTTLLNVVVTYGADPTGVADSGAEIQAAINDAIAANNGSVVYLPAGTYRTTGGFTGTLTSSNFTIRGAGSDLTTLVYDNSTPSQRCFSFGNGSAYDYPPTDNILLSGNTQGSTSVTVADASPFSIGMMVRIDWENQDDDVAIEAGAVPTIHTYGFGRVRKQTVVLTNVNTSTDTLTFYPPIIHDPTGLTARVFLSTFPLQKIGIEGMTLDGSDSVPFSLIEFQDCHDCWVDDVKVRKANNYNINFAGCVNMEVRHCTVSERTAGGTNGAGILSNNCSGILVEDCIFFDLSPCIEWNFCTVGSVFAFNFVDGTANINHGPHNSFNLYEGNIITFLQSDGYFGGASEDTIYRNWLTGVSYAGSQTAIVSLHRFARKFSLAGNILGNPAWPYGTDPYTWGRPNLGNSFSDSTHDMTAGDFPIDWKMTATLTTRTNATSGVMTLISGSMRTAQFRAFCSAGEISSVVVLTGGSDRGDGKTTTLAGGTFSFTSAGTLPSQGSTMTITAGPEGYQELDLDVQGTAVLKGNRQISSGSSALLAGEDLGGDTLADSLFRGSKPAYFASLTWPPIVPTNGATASYVVIPAGYRFVNASDPPAEPGGSVTANTGNAASVIVRQ